MAEYEYEKNAIDAECCVENNAGHHENAILLRLLDSRPELLFAT